jgi:hypothetical protein
MASRTWSADRGRKVAGNRDFRPVGEGESFPGFHRKTTGIWAPKGHPADLALLLRYFDPEAVEAGRLRLAPATPQITSPDIRPAGISHTAGSTTTPSGDRTPAAADTSAAFVSERGNAAVRRPASDREPVRTPNAAVCTGPPVESPRRGDGARLVPGSEGGRCHWPRLAGSTPAKVRKSVMRNVLRCDGSVGVHRRLALR